MWDLGDSFALPDLYLSSFCALSVSLSPLSVTEE